MVVRRGVPGPAGRLAMWAVRGVLGLAALAALLGLGGRFSRTLDILNHLTPLYLIASIGLLALAARERPTRWSFLGLGAAGALASLWLMVPDLAAHIGEPRPRPGRGLTVTVLTQNLWARNITPLATADAILKARPDVVAVQEADGPSREIVRLLAADYPYRADCTVISQWCSDAILSRRPILSWSYHIPAWKPPDWDRVSLVRATIDGGPGGPFEVVTTHLMHPDPQGIAASQAAQLLDHLDGIDPKRAILMGDFNLTPWAFGLRRIDAQLSITRRSHGVATWPRRLPMLGGAWFPMPFLPIDQIYAGSAWKVKSLGRGPSTGSDHYGLLATLVYQP